MLDKKEVGNDKLAGYGLSDLDYLLKNDNVTNEVKIRLNFECTDIGWVNLRIRF